MNNQMNLGWLLLFLGLSVAAFGLILIAAPAIPWLGRLPGDVRIETENTRFYFPLTTCLLVSLVLSLILWIVRAFRG